MKAYLLLIALIPFSAALVSESLYANKIVPNPQRAQIRLAGSEESFEMCRKYLDAVVFHLNSFKRFRLTDKRPNILIEVSCAANVVRLEWYWLLKAKKDQNIKANSIELVVADQLIDAEDTNYNAVGLNLVRTSFSQLRWDGEVLEVHPTSSVDTADELMKIGAQFLLGESDDENEHSVVRLSAGTLVEPYLGMCVPIDVGYVAVRKKKILGKIVTFEKVGNGILTVSGPHQSVAEIFVPKDKMRKLKRKLVYVFSNPADVSDEQDDLVSECKEKLEDIEVTTLSKILSGNLLGLFDKDIIELTRVSQYGGMSYSLLEGNSGQTTPGLFSIYLQNEFNLGSYFNGDLRAYRHLITKPWEFEGLDEVRDPSLTFGEGLFHLRLTHRNNMFAIGGGLAIEKSNVPYRPVGKALYQERISRTHTTLSFKYRYERPLYWVTMRLTGSPKKRFGYRGIGFDFKRTLTKTWFFGGDFSYYKVDPTDVDEPGYKFMSIGGHIGFDIKREPERRFPDRFR